MLGQQQHLAPTLMQQSYSDLLQCAPLMLFMSVVISSAHYLVSGVVTSCWFLVVKSNYVCVW
jgi:hypothetical protein